MTRDELNELKLVVRRAVEEEREMYDEVWLTEKQLLEQFGMFTHDWLKKYGQCLQPARAIVWSREPRSPPSVGTTWRSQKGLAFGLKALTAPPLC